MQKDASLTFGQYIRRLRQERKLSLRGLANEAGVDSGALTRLEQDKVRAPQPETLNGLARALQVPQAAIFKKAGYAVYDLPSAAPARYDRLPGELRRSVDNYIERLIDEYGLDPSGPLALEDEADGSAEIK